MKPGMPLLLALLRGDRYAPATVPEWQETLDLAAAEAVLPWLLNLLSASSATLPAPVVETLRQAGRDARIQAFLYTSELTHILKAFAGAGLPVILLKGPSLAERLYGSTACRTSRDLDLLVRPQHFARAQSLLQSLGFLPSSLPDDYHQCLSRNTTAVELHFNVENPLAFDFHMPSAWQAAQPTTFNGQPALLFAPADELLYLCLHGVRHRFDRLSYALDIALAIRHVGLLTTLRPQVQSLAGLLTLGIALAHKLIPASPDPRPGEHIQAIAERVWQRVLTTPAGDPDWEALHRFYLELEPTAPHRIARHVRHLRILAARITQPDRDFAANLGLPYHWAAHVVRPFRLLWKRSH